MTSSSAFLCSTILLPPRPSFVVGTHLSSRCPFTPSLPRNHPCTPHITFKAEYVEDDMTKDQTRIPEEGLFSDTSDTVVIQPSFALAGAFLFTGGFLTYQGNIWIVPGFPSLLIGILLAVQSIRVRFVFGKEQFSIAQRKGEGELQFIVGWKYQQFTNWEYWWKNLPILFYFKEKESYDGRGSIHFFPIICNSNQLLEQMLKNTTHLDNSKYQ